jgi:hypothetical protein
MLPDVESPILVIAHRRPWSCQRHSGDYQEKWGSVRIADPGGTKLPEFIPCREALESVVQGA